MNDDPTIAHLVGPDGLVPIYAPRGATRQWLVAAVRFVLPTALRIWEPDQDPDVVRVSLCIAGEPSSWSNPAGWREWEYALGITRAELARVRPQRVDPFLQVLKDLADGRTESPPEPTTRDLVLEFDKRYDAFRELIHKTAEALQDRVIPAAPPPEPVYPRMRKPW